MELNSKNCQIRQTLSQYLTDEISFFRTRMLQAPAAAENDPMDSKTLVAQAVAAAETKAQMQPLRLD